MKFRGEYSFSQRFLEQITTNRQGIQFSGATVSDDEKVRRYSAEIRCSIERSSAEFGDSSTHNQIDVVRPAVRPAVFLPTRPEPSRILHLSVCQRQRSQHSCPCRGCCRVNGTTLHGRWRRLLPLLLDHKLHLGKRQIRKET